MNWEFTISCTNDSTEVVLSDEPMDWASYEITVKRDAKLHGKLIDMTNSLTFYDEGYDFIRAKYDEFGVDAELIMDVVMDCDGVEESLPTARINMSSLDFEEGTICLVTANLEEASCVMQFKNRTDLKVSLFDLDTVDDPGGGTLAPYGFIDYGITLEPKGIVKTDTADYEEDDENATTFGLHDFEPTILSDPQDIDDAMYHWLSWPRFTEELDSDDFNDELDSGTNTNEDTAEWVWKPPAQFVFTGVTWDFDIHVVANIDIWVDFDDTVNESNCSFNGGFDTITVNTILRRFNTNLLTYDDVVINTEVFTDCYANSPSTGGTVFGIPSAEVTIDFDYAAVPFPAIELDDQIILVFEVIWKGSYDTFPAHAFQIFTKQQVTILNGSFFKVSTLTLFPHTTAHAALVNEALSRIAEKLTGDCLRMYSDYFHRVDSEPYTKADPGDVVDTTPGCGALEAVTNGLLIRRIEDAKFFISWNDLYNSLNAIHCLGMGIEDDPFRPGYQRLRVERATFFYEDDLIDFLVDFPTVIHRTIKADVFFTKFTIGYSLWEAEQFNGLDEFATKRVYTSKQNHIGGELSQVSVISASGYAIEVTRQEATTTKDWRYDNTPFIICVDDTYLVVEQGNIASPLNIIDPDTVYNFRLSPARNAIRWFEFLFSMFKDHTDTDLAKLLFTSGEGNYIAEGLVTGGCIPESDVLNESQDLIYTDKSDADTELPRLGWEEWSFQYPVSFAEYIEIKNNFYKRISVRWEPNLYQEAYIQEVVWRPADSIASFKCIRAVAAADQTPFLDILLQENGDALLLETGDHILL